MLRNGTLWNRETENYSTASMQIVKCDRSGQLRKDEETHLGKNEYPNQIKLNEFFKPGSRSRPHRWHLPRLQVTINAPSKQRGTWDPRNGSKRCQQFTVRSVWISERIKMGKNGFWVEWWMNGDDELCKSNGREFHSEGAAREKEPEARAVSILKLSRSSLSEERTVKRLKQVK